LGFLVCNFLVFFFLLILICCFHSSSIALKRRRIYRADRLRGINYLAASPTVIIIQTSELYTKVLFPKLVTLVHNHILFRNLFSQCLVMSPVHPIPISSWPRTVAPRVLDPRLILFFILPSHAHLGRHAIDPPPVGSLGIKREVVPHLQFPSAHKAHRSIIPFLR